MPKVNVRPGIQKVSHDMSLALRKDIYGFRVANRISGVGEQPATPTTQFKSQPQGLYGDYDPDFSHLEQKSWIGGRGSEVWHDDTTSYWHARDAWTASPDHLASGLLWKWADGAYRDYNHHIPGSVSFVPLLGSRRYISVPFTPGATYSADKMYVLLRRRGNPHTLTCAVYSDSGGDPNTLLGTFSATTSISTITDVVSLWAKFDPTGTQSVSSGTTYHIVIYATTNDDQDNMWEVGVDTSTSASKVSSDGSTWSIDTFKLYHRIVDADVAKKVHYFHLVKDDGTLVWMAVTEPASGNSEIYEWDETNDTWVAVTPSTDVTGTVVDVAVSDNIAFMARGNGSGIYQLYDVSGTWTGYVQSDGEGADVIRAFRHTSDGPQVARFENNTWVLSRGSVPSAGADITFGTDIQFPKGFNGLNSLFYNDKLWIRTTDTIYSVSGDTPVELNVGLAGMIAEVTYDAPMLAKDLFMFFGWGFSLERVFGGSVDDIGPWRNGGLPSGLQGEVSALANDIALVWVGVDGGSSKTSSVFATVENGQNYHPVWQAWEAGQRVRNLAVQSQTSDNNRRLWISVGGDMVYIELPDQSVNPLNDENQEHVWESVIELGSMPIRYGLPKIYHEFQAQTKLLGSTASIALDYQLDEDVGKSDPSTWVHAGDFSKSGRDSLILALGGASNIRIRLRLMTKSSTSPVDVRAHTMKAVARTPHERYFTMNVELGHRTTYDGQEEHDPIELVEWVYSMADEAEALLMRTTDPTMDLLWVQIDNPSVIRRWLDDEERRLSGSITLALRTL